MAMQRWTTWTPQARLRTGTVMSWIFCLAMNLVFGPMNPATLLSESLLIHLLIWQGWRAIDCTKAPTNNVNSLGGAQ